MLAGYHGGPPDPARRTGCRVADSRAAPSRERCAGGDVSTLTAAAAPIDGQVLEGRAEPRPWRVDIAPAPSGGGGRSATRYANLTGFPDLIVPAGFTGDGLPVGLSFLGRASSRASWPWVTPSSRRPGRAGCRCTRRRSAREGTHGGATSDESAGSDPVVPFRTTRDSFAEVARTCPSVLSMTGECMHASHHRPADLAAARRRRGGACR